MTDTKTGLKQNRRTALKSLVIGGAAVSGGELITEQWSRPVVNAINLPAHAQTTGSVFSTGTVEITALQDSQPWWEDNPIMKGLIPEVVAGGFDDQADGVVISACGEEFDSDAYDYRGAFSLLFEILANNDVNICFQSLGTSSFAQRCTGSTVSTINGSSIADASIKMIDASREGELEEMEDVMLSNLVLNSSAMTVSGTAKIYNPRFQSNSISCDRNFVAQLTSGVFNCQPGCLPQV